MHQAAVIAQRWVTRLIIGRSCVQILRDAGIFTASLSLSTLCDVSLNLIFNKTWLAVQLEMKQAKYAPHLKKRPMWKGYCTTAQYLQVLDKAQFSWVDSLKNSTNLS